MIYERRSERKSVIDQRPLRGRGSTLTDFTFRSSCGTVKQLRAKMVVGSGHFRPPSPPPPAIGANHAVVRTCTHEVVVIIEFVRQRLRMRLLTTPDDGVDARALLNDVDIIAGLHFGQQPRWSPSEDCEH
ncbi:unnamed protein product [Soboliphyme baturini]|uniref:Uncharacterized protein n=1 Tax=Soboliphyme baturini TaxID=241478 RepID=A0A183J1Y5_9BILA|nr:unnamed protein product [Soboliphyme baturini]